MKKNEDINKIYERASERLKLFRKYRGITQEELAETLSITQSSLNHFINSNRKPSFEMVLKICIALNLSSSSAKPELIDAIGSVLKNKKERLANKQISPLMKVMIIGVPNTGKSTLINNLSFAKKATTGDKAGVTKHTQWVKVSDNLALLDTPGTLWPSMKDEMVSLKLAFVGSIKDDVLDTTELGFELIKFLMKDHLEILQERFSSVNFNMEPIDVYDQIAKVRGCIVKGGDVDYDRLGKAVLVDFRSGRMGRITLDRID